MGKKTFYITTAIDYPNGAPHMGHAYEKVVTDAYARWYRLLGYDVRFLTGTDENGQKLAKAAASAGVQTRAFVDQNVEKFVRLCNALNVSHDDFIRTTEERHHEVVKEIWRELERNGDVYFGKYSGLYCLACEAFYTETQAPEKMCPEHHAPLELVEEEGYFFKLSRYQQWITDHLKNNKSFLTPSSARSEMLGRLAAEPLNDLSISRPNAGWGIPVPGNEKHVIYTWFDALINYYSALHGRDESLKRYWPADVHVVGKDITWFHSVIWPVMLHAAKIPVPKQVYVHGMVLAEDGRKMSKSLGNGVDPMEVVGRFQLDSFRYYLLRAIPSGGDGSFSLKDLEQRHNSELANELGNTYTRTLKLSLKRLGATVSPPDSGVDIALSELKARMAEAMDQREHVRALDALWEGVRQVNVYLNAKEPWRIKDDDASFHKIMYTCLSCLYTIAQLLRPFMPSTSEKALRSLGCADHEVMVDDPTRLVFTLSEPEPLFPRIE